MMMEAMMIEFYYYYYHYYYNNIENLVQHGNKIKQNYYNFNLFLISPNQNPM